MLYSKKFAISYKMVACYVNNVKGTLKIIKGREIFLYNDSIYATVPEKFIEIFCWRSVSYRVVVYVK